MGVYGPHARVVMSCVIPNIAELRELRVQRGLTFGIADPEIGSKPASGFARIANCAAPYWEARPGGAESLERHPHSS